MIRREPRKGTDQVKVTFSVPADGHGRVSVVGEFNAWNPTANSLAKRGDRCRASVMIASGRRYSFRYLASDGNWFNDEAADAYQSNGMGAENSILDLTAAL